MEHMPLDERLARVARDIVAGLVERDGPDLTVRQLATMLICTVDPGPHTVRGLAARLRVSRPAITRAVDRLCELGLMNRFDDPDDRRSVLMRPSPQGEAFVADLRQHALFSARSAGLGALQPV